MHRACGRQALAIGVVFKAMSRLPQTVPGFVDVQIVNMGIEQANGNICAAIRSFGNDVTERLQRLLPRWCSPYS